MSTLPPEQPGDQPEQPQHVQPEQPVAPAAPATPEYTAPPAAPAAPQHTAPPAGGYQQPAPAAAPADAAVSTITLNYWLSVFFAWIPALIFWIIEKDKGNQRANAFHVANLNFSLLRTGVGVAIFIIGLIPYIGWLIALVLWLGQIVLFVFHIMAAAKAADNYRNGGSTDPFIFNIPLIK